MGTKISLSFTPGCKIVELNTGDDRRKLVGFDRSHRESCWKRSRYLKKRKKVICVHCKDVVFFGDKYSRQRDNREV